MKRKYIFVLVFAIILNVLFVCMNTSPFYNPIDGTYFSEITGKLIWCGLYDLLLIFFASHMSQIFDMPYEILMNGRLVWSLAKNDFKVKYVGSYLGIFWAFINPLVTILLYWLVFQFAFKSGDVDGHPFVLWLMSGLIPWFLIQDAIINGTNALMEYAYLVKKVMFQVSILPAIKVFSACFVHVVFMVVALVIFMLLGYFPTIYMTQFFYYFVCAVVFTLAIVYATSAVVLFLRDLGQFISVFMQVFMWATPIMWRIDIVPEQYRWFFKLNPTYYIITGYRDAMLYNTSVFHHLGYTLYFWVFVIILLILSSTIFKKLRPHFADVL
jgi:teichoic acid transport system permease protein